MAVFRITSGKAVESGRPELDVDAAGAEDDVRVLAAVADLGVCNSALRLSRAWGFLQIPNTARLSRDGSSDSFAVSYRSLHRGTR